MTNHFSDSLKLNYAELGFCAGLEIHAQLESQRKLFCHCSPELVPPDAISDYQFERFFRPVLGELGDFDEGMLVEFEKHYRVIYETFGDNICTYEMDETPPFTSCKDTINLGFKLAKYLNCKSPVNEIIFNRKQYLDGSITTGFQRTTIIARDGYIPLKDGGKVRINNVLIEEDAARRVNFVDRASRTVFFNLDRLGIPLTEIITNHLDCHDPVTLQEIALLLGLGIRVLGIAKRGIGTIRQDVNISITEGSRVELKGIQNIRDLKKYCDHEILRQLALLEIRKVLLERNIAEDEFLSNFIEVSSAVNNLKPSEIALSVRLPKCEGIFTREVQPGKSFAEDVFDRIELITGIPIGSMAHSGLDYKWLDSLRVREILNLQSNDSFIVIRGSQAKLIHALSRTVERMKLALRGVPEETRRINPNNYNSEFLRVIHGKDRMYSDTDTPPISIDLDYFAINYEGLLPPWEITKRFPISTNEIAFIEKIGFYNEFVDLVTKIPKKSRTFLGHLQYIYSLQKKGVFNRKNVKKIIVPLIIDVTNHKISKDKIETILKEVKYPEDYDRKKYLTDQKILDDELFRRFNAVIDNLEGPAEKYTINHLFGILKAHFPMLTSEQIYVTLKKLKKLI
ncbi:MAG: Glu-tRNA(Gln) amidotransferase subunit GatE [Candidatus Hodarchaeales archaeon]